MAPQTQTQYDSAQLATAARTSFRQLADQLDVLRIVESNVADWTQLQAALADAAAMVAEMCARERDAREAETRANKRAEAADKAAKRAKDDMARMRARYDEALAEAEHASARRLVSATGCLRRSRSRGRQTQRRARRRTSCQPNSKR